ncbi:MAG: DUF3418 domain-containing protein [Austwickia sp.]|nr:DUF3418 domain-containing protein [Austwickia sp.]
MDLTDELSRVLRARTGVVVPAGEWDLSRVPDHLRITFRIEDARRRRVAEGKDLGALKEALAPQVRDSMKAAAAAIEKRGITTWTDQSIGELPVTFERRVGGRILQGYPAVVDHQDSVAVEVLASAAERDVATRAGVRRLLLLNTTVPWPRILALLSNEQKLALGHNPHGGVPALLEDVLAAAVDAIVAGRGTGGVRDERQFAAALAGVRQQIVPAVIEVVEVVQPILDLARQVGLAVESMTAPGLADLRQDLRGQLADLVYDGFVADTGLPQLRQVARYLRGMLHRIGKAPNSPLDLARDAQRRSEVAQVEAERVALIAALPAHRRHDADVLALRWMVQELRISLFAQPLGTAYPVSAKRIYKAMDALDAIDGS